ncbi:MAG: hypothetical protein HC812_08545 [Leptolyngbya sp. RL_3_1]|nr:hypothetical protein [Leptolyngbya sp. RL_3_1]
MTNRLWIGGRLLALALIAIVSLTACGGAGPPQDVLTQAVTQQAEQTQRQLWQGVSRQADAPQLQVKRIKPIRTQSIRVDGQDAYQIKGSYQLELRYSARRVQQKAPFEVILKPTSNSEAWQWLYPMNTGPGEAPQWQTQVLSHHPQDEG